MFLEGHVRSATPGGERVYETLTDEETNGDADCDLDHAQAECKAAVVLLHGAVIVSSETTSLGKARLEGKRSAFSETPRSPTSRDTSGAHTGTRKSTPVTIEVKAVPRDHLE